MEVAMRDSVIEPRPSKREYSAGLREALRAEIREELDALAKFEAQHGSFPELVRAHYHDLDR
jgi:hypothetical protein